MSEYNYTEYFENEILQKRPYLKKDWCIHAGHRKSHQS